MNHFHAQGMVIGDIKPSRLFINPEGHIKMFSFSMCQLFQSKLTRSKTAFKGAPFYMAPEVKLG